MGRYGSRLKDAEVIAFLKTMPEPFSLKEVNDSYRLDHYPACDTIPVLPTQWYRLRRRREIILELTKPRFAGIPVSYFSLAPEHK